MPQYQGSIEEYEEKIGQKVVVCEKCRIHKITKLNKGYIEIQFFIRDEIVPVEKKLVTLIDCMSEEKIAFIEYNKAKDEEVGLIIDKEMTTVFSIFGKSIEQNDEDLI